MHKLGVLFTIIFTIPAAALDETKGGVTIASASNPWSPQISAIRAKINDGIKADYLLDCANVQTVKVIRRPSDQIWEFTVKRILDIRMEQDFDVDLNSNDLSQIQKAVDTIIDSDQLDLDGLNYKENLIYLMYQKLEPKRYIRMFLSELGATNVVSLADTSTSEVLVVSVGYCN